MALLDIGSQTGTRSSQSDVCGVVLRKEPHLMNFEARHVMVERPADTSFESPFRSVPDSFMTSIFPLGLGAERQIDCVVDLRN